MTSRGNTGTCRYAYPECPTDPEQLIHYLNNHNGGFFRFFNAPLPSQNLEQFHQLGQNGQNLEQFYDHLGLNGQYGQLQFGQDFNGQQNVGINQQNLQQGPGSYGLYQNLALNQQGYGLQNNHIGNQNPDLHGYGNQNYGSNYDYNTYGSNNVRYKDGNAKIEKRIQNKPGKDDVLDSLQEENDNVNTKWLFPGETNSNDNQNIYDDNETDKDALKFPEESENQEDKRDFKRKSKSILFPENQYNQNAYSNKKFVNTDNRNEYNSVQTHRPYYQNDYNKINTGRPYYQNHYYNNQKVVNANLYKHTTATPFNENDYYYDHKHNFYVKKEQNKENYYNHYNKNQNNINYNNNNYNTAQKPVNYGDYNNYANSKINDGSQTVYIVRGNGDPNRPEIVKVRPGQTVN